MANFTPLEAIGGGLGGAVTVGRGGGGGGYEGLGGCSDRDQGNLTRLDGSGVGTRDGTTPRSPLRVRSGAASEVDDRREECREEGLEGTAD